jgi:hypothetical protein
MSIPLGGDGLYPDSEEFPGLRSLTATIIMVIAPGAVTWALAFIE